MLKQMKISIIIIFSYVILFVIISSIRSDEKITTVVYFQSGDSVIYNYKSSKLVNGCLVISGDRLCGVKNVKEY